MSWNDDVLTYISQHPYLPSWPDARVVLDAFDAHLRKLPPTALPLHTCHAAGGQPAQAVPLGAAFTLLHMAASVLDDFQDQDTELPWAGWSLERALGSTLSMVFLSQSCLARLDAPEPAKGEIIDAYAQGWLLASVGQNQAVDPRQMSATYWRHALAKASVGFAVAAWSGVRLATGDVSQQQAAREFGMALGTLLQVADDIQDFLAAPQSRFPSALEASLPVVLACQQVHHPAQAHLSQCLQLDRAERDPSWAGAVYDSVLAAGGLSRALATGKVYEQKAIDCLSAFSPERSYALADYVRSILPDYAA